MDRELVIPVYQRNYDWGTKQCEQLLADLVSLIREDRPKHFFGSVVGDAEDSFHWVVIDGQQRLTTVSLLMLAIVHRLESGNVTSADAGLAGKIKRSYLLASSGDEQPRFRLKQVQDDAEAYRRLFADESEYVETSNITANYRIFMNRIPALDITIDELWAAIERLELMHLDLESHDDAQRIFESLNSTGLALSEADKIRNFVLMGLPVKDQPTVYEHYWNRIEKDVGFDTTNFLRWYLASKTAQAPKTSEVYDKFKSYAHDRKEIGIELLGPVREYADHFRRIKDADTGSVAIDQRLRRFPLKSAEVVFPFLLAIIADWRSEKITERDVVECLRMLESYLFRRFTDRQPTNSLGTIFASLHRDVTRVRTPKYSFPDVLAYQLLRRSTSTALPDNAAFAEAFRTRDFYPILKEWSQYLFESLENLDSKDTRDIADRIDSKELTLEHIMPQTMTNEWRAELGDEADEVHRTWLHRIGNLTVTGYNSTYSNASFNKKKTMKGGFDGSPYRLNHDIRDASRWGEEQIRARTERLLSDALEYWQYPTTSFEAPVLQLPAEPMGTDTQFTNRSIVSFEYETTRATVDSWREFAQRLLQELLQINRSSVLEFARTNDAFHVGQAISLQQPRWIKLDEGLSWNLSSSTMTKVQTIRRLFEHLQLDPDDVLITLRPTDIAADTGENAEAAAGPYTDIVKFRDLVATRREAATRDDQDDTLLDKFRTAFAPFLDPQPATILKGSAEEFADDPARVERATSRQILALISTYRLQEAFDPNALWRIVVDGRLTQWLDRLTPSSQEQG